MFTLEMFVQSEDQEILDLLDLYTERLNRRDSTLATLSIGLEGAFVLTLPESVISPKPEAPKPTAPTPTLHGADYEAAELRALRVARDVLGARLIAKRGGV